MNVCYGKLAFGVRIFVKKEIAQILFIQAYVPKQKDAMQILLLKVVNHLLIVMLWLLNHKKSVYFNQYIVDYMIPQQNNVLA